MPEEGTTGAETELERTNTKLAELERKEAERKAIEGEKNKQAANKAAADLTAAQKKLEEAEARLQSYADRDLAAANAIYEILPEDAKKRADLVRGALSPEKWLEYLSAEGGSANQADPERPAPKMPVTGDGGPPENNKGKYQPKHPDWIEENFGRKPQYLQRLNVTEEKNGTRFVLTTKEFMRSQTSRGIKPKK
jgi:hypothetical protein